MNFFAIDRHVKFIRDKQCPVNRKGFQNLLSDHKNDKPKDLHLERNGHISIYYDNASYFLSPDEGALGALGKGAYGSIHQYNVTRIENSSGAEKKSTFKCAVKKPLDRRKSIATVPGFDFSKCGHMEVVEFDELTFVIMPLLFGNLYDFAAEYSKWLLEILPNHAADIFQASLLYIFLMVHEQLECLRVNEFTYTDVKPNNIGYVCGDGVIQFPLIDIDGIRATMSHEHESTFPNLFLRSKAGSYLPTFRDPKDLDVERCHTHALAVSILLLLAHHSNIHNLYEKTADFFSWKSTSRTKGRDFAEEFGEFFRTNFPTRNIVSSTMHEIMISADRNSVTAIVNRSLSTIKLPKVKYYSE